LSKKYIKLTYIKQMLKTAEFVSPKHPDKICDLIADSILDAYLAKDKNARVAVEVMGGHGHITVSGEITRKKKVDIEKVVRKIVGTNFKVSVYAVRQSPEIAQGVDTGGAGDQGIMAGYATNETKNFMPYEYELARSLCREIYKKYPFDGKVQVTVGDNPSAQLNPLVSPLILRGDKTAEKPPLRIRGGEGELRPKVLSVVASFQNSKTSELLKLVKKLVKADDYFINQAGEWQIGGFDADSGLSGRKIVVDNYGPNLPVGGGSFSGKDYTKVDRSGAYMARKIAVDLVKKQKAKTAMVKLAYVIGKAEPVMATAIVDGKEISFPKGYDLTPVGIRKFLKLDRAIFAHTSSWGHFGREFTWDK